MKASSLTTSLISAVALFAAAGTATAQDTAGAGASCPAGNAVSSVAEHDTVYDPLNGVTNGSPDNKAPRMGWKKRGLNDTGSCGSNAAADALVPVHDTVYDPLNGITNDAPINKVSRMDWKR
jgi:hypothetical protein